MKKEKVFIVISHKHTPKKGQPGQWDRIESIEFVNQLRNRHHTMSSAIGDYINRTMIKGDRVGMGDYDKFETYIRKQYEKEMAQLDNAYKELQVQHINAELLNTEVFADEFGNVRPKTIFDKEPA